MDCVFGGKKEAKEVDNPYIDKCVLLSHRSKYLKNNKKKGCIHLVRERMAALPITKLSDDPDVVRFAVQMQYTILANYLEKSFGDVLDNDRPVPSKESRVRFFFNAAEEVRIALVEAKSNLPAMEKLNPFNQSVIRALLQTSHFYNIMRFGALTKLDSGCEQNFVLPFPLDPHGMDMSETIYMAKMQVEGVPLDV
jgi:hypothetical protein